MYFVLRSKYGLQISLAEQIIVASLANEGEYEIFEVDPPAAVLRMKRITKTKQKKVVEYVESVSQSGFIDKVRKVEDPMELEKILNRLD